MGRGTDDYILVVSRFKKKKKKHHSEDTDLPGGVSRGANSYSATYLVKNELTVFSHHWIIHSPGLSGQHGSVCWHSGGMGITKLPIAAKKSRLLSELAPLCSINQLCLCVQFISQRNSRSCPTLVRDSYACGSIWGCNSAAEEQLPVREGGKGPLELRTYGPGFTENVAPG